MLAQRQLRMIARMPTEHAGHAVCVPCGVHNSLLRVYLAMKSPAPNLIALACKSCGGTAPQLRSPAEYVLFSTIYSGITLTLLIAALTVAGSGERIVWYATLSASVPFLFLPAWWALQNTPKLAAAAPAEDLTLSEKLVCLALSIAIIVTILGGGLFAFLLYGMR